MSICPSAPTKMSVIALVTCRELVLRCRGPHMPQNYEVDARAASRVPGGAVGRDVSQIEGEAAGPAPRGSPRGRGSTRRRRARGAGVRVRVERRRVQGSASGAPEGARAGSARCARARFRFRYLCRPRSPFFVVTVRHAISVYSTSLCRRLRWRSTSARRLRRRSPCHRPCPYSCPLRAHGTASAYTLPR
jgi:hypothetical protein